MLKRNYATRSIRAFQSRSLTPEFSKSSVGALGNNDSESVFSGQTSFRCNRYLGVFDKLYREFHRALPNAEKQGFYDTFLRKHGGVSYSKKHWSGRGNVVLFSLRYDYGHTYLTIEGVRVLTIENGTTSYLDDQGEIVRIPYSGESVPAPVLRRFRAFLDKAQRIECVFKPVPVEVKHVHDWSIIQWSYGEKPEFKAIKGKTVTKQVRVIRGSNKRYHWNIRYKDANNCNYHKDDYGTIPKAYKVEIDGVVAWLPHSILGENYSAITSGTIEIPEWWYKKSVKGQ